MPLQELTTEGEVDREVLREALLLIMTDTHNAKKAVIQCVTGQSTSHHTDDGTVEQRARTMHP